MQNQFVSSFCSILYVAAFILLYFVCTQMSHRSQQLALGFFATLLLQILQGNSGILYFFYLIISYY